MGLFASTQIIAKSIYSLSPGEWYLSMTPTLFFDEYFQQLNYQFMPISWPLWLIFLYFSCDGRRYFNNFILFMLKDDDLDSIKK